MPPARNNTRGEEGVKVIMMHAAPTIHALLAFLAVIDRAAGWVSISQSAYGGQIDDIAAQLRGEGGREHKVGVDRVGRVRLCAMV